jgi:hypothetical protein
MEPAMALLARVGALEMLDMRMDGGGEIGMGWRRR